MPGFLIGEYCLLEKKIYETINLKWFYLWPGLRSLYLYNLYTRLSTGRDPLESKILKKKKSGAKITTSNPSTFMPKWLGIESFLPLYVMFQKKQLKISCELSWELINQKHPPKYYDSKFWKHLLQKLLWKNYTRMLLNRVTLGSRWEWPKSFIFLASS